MSVTLPEVRLAPDEDDGGVGVPGPDGGAPVVDGREERRGVRDLVADEVDDDARGRGRRGQGGGGRRQGGPLPPIEVRGWKGFSVNKAFIVHRLRLKVA